MKKIATISTLLTAAALFSAPSYADVFTTEASFSQSLPLHFEQGVPAMAHIDFEQRFKSIDRICFTVSFAGDLADPGEGLMYGPFRSSRYGWNNIHGYPLESRGTCITPAHNGADSFLDGVQSFGVEMSKGQATMTKLLVQVTGESEDAAPMPTLAVSVGLDEGEGVVSAAGGKVNYDVSVENLDFSLSYKDLIRWSVLTLPTGEHYSAIEPSEVQLGSGEVKNYQDSNIDIPGWFPAGQYQLSWYVADPENEEYTIMSDTLVFEKLAK